MTTPGTLGRTIWISWEKHRRTRELRGEFGAELFELLLHGPYLIKVPVLMIRTLWTLLRTRPEILIVQNPSVVLASWVGLLRGLFGYRLVVDRHSNFKLHTLESRSLKYRVFHYLSRYSIRAADITIVTNEPLSKLVEQWGGVGHVLPDKFPELDCSLVTDLGPGSHVLYICSFDSDEPIDVVLAAAAQLPEDVLFHVTGNPGRMGGAEAFDLPANVRLTGYLEDSDYLKLLNSCDMVMTLTDNPHTMQCGAYEAVSAGKPLVMGPDQAMVDYFFKGSVPVALDPGNVAGGIREVLENRERLAAETRDLYIVRSADWKKMFEALTARMAGVGQEG